MFQYLHYFLNTVLGLTSDQQFLPAWQMAIRAFIVYTVAVMLVRLGRKRFLAKPSSFDLVLLLMLGSVLSRSITGNAPFFQTLVAGTILIVIHTFFSAITFYSTRWGALIKGRAMILIKDGKVNWDNMRRAQLTERDLLSALRRNGQLQDYSKVKLAILERNGEISIIKKKKEIFYDINVQPGIQVVRIHLEEKD